jgi:hypothetical protein
VPDKSDVLFVCRSPTTPNLLLRPQTVRESAHHFVRDRLLVELDVVPHHGVWVAADGDRRISRVNAVLPGGRERPFAELTRVDRLAIRIRVAIVDE